MEETPRTIFQKSQKVATLYASTGGAPPLIHLSFIFTTDFWHAFALILHAILHYNNILVFEVTLYHVISQKSQKKAALSILLGFYYATNYGTLSL